MTSWTEFLFSAAKNININNLTNQHTPCHYNLVVATSLRCEFKPHFQIIYKHTIKIFSSVGAWFSKGFKQRSARYDIIEIFEIKIYWISIDLRNPSIDIFEIMLITSHGFMLTHKLYSWIMRDGIKSVLENQLHTFWSIYFIFTTTCYFSKEAWHITTMRAYHKYGQCVKIVHVFKLCLKTKLHFCGVS